MALRSVKLICSRQWVCDREAPPLGVPLSDEPPQPAAGWYPTPDGNRRYWDGSTWLARPEPELPDATPGPDAVNTFRSKRRLPLVLALSIVGVLLVGGGGAVVWKMNADAAAAAAAEAAAALKAQEEKEAAAEAQRAEEAQEALDDAERAWRDAAVPGIEASIKEMATKHHGEGLIDAPPIDVTCSPVGGGSTGDLTATTTVFECFVATVDNGDGTMTGFTYNATMNWTTGEYTYGFGAP